MDKNKKISKRKNRRNKNNKDWSVMDEVRHPTPKSGFAFKDRKRALKDEESLKEMKDYR